MTWDYRVGTTDKPVVAAQHIAGRNTRAFKMKGSSVNNSNGITVRRPSDAPTSPPTATVTATPSVMIGTKPTLLTKSLMRFLIMDAPRASNLHVYIKECRKHHVTDCVRVCEPTYVAGELQSAGIVVHEMAYPDGTSPPKDVLDRWLALVDEKFYRPTPPMTVPVVKSSSQKSTNSVAADGTGNSESTTASGATPVSPPAPPSTASSDAGAAPTIAVHCVAGLGRAPVLVAIALIEFEGMDPIEAVTLIRRHRRGAINEKQLNYLEGYKRTYKRGGKSECNCVIQ